MLTQCAGGLWEKPRETGGGSRGLRIVHRLRGRLKPGLSTTLSRGIFADRIAPSGAARTLRRPARRGKSAVRCLPKPRRPPRLHPLILASRSAGRAALLRAGARAVRDRAGSGRRGRGEGRHARRGGAAARHRRRAGRTQGAAAWRRASRTASCSAPTRSSSATAGSTTSPATSPRRAPSSPRCADSATSFSPPPSSSRAPRPVWRHVGRAQLTMRPFSDAFLDALHRRARGGASLHRRRLPPRRRRRAAVQPGRGRPLHHHGPAAPRAPGLPPHPRDRPRMSAAPLLAGVVGWPIAHSRSPRLHGHWLRRYRIDGYYIPIALHAGGLRGRAPGGAGAGVPRRQRHHPAQGSRTGARHRGEPARGGHRRRQHADLRPRRRGPCRQHRRLRLHRQSPPARAGLARRGRAGAGARRRRQRPRHHRRAARRRRAGSAGRRPHPAARRGASRAFRRAYRRARLGGGGRTPPPTPPPS